MNDGREAKPAPTTAKLDGTLGLLLAVLVIGCVFQIFFRYQYVNASKTTVVRVDRLTNDSCVLPCNGDGYAAVAPVPGSSPSPSPQPEKVCHDADIVRVEGRFPIPPPKTPAPYAAGGFPAAESRHIWKRKAVGNVLELSDGHVYVFAPRTFKTGSGYWSTGQDVQVCATWSRLESRPYYSVGSSGDADPAVLAF